MKIYPFRSWDASDFFRSITEEVTKEIQELENEYVLKASQVELENYYMEKALVHPLILHTAQRYLENQVGIKSDVSHDFIRATSPGERVIVQGTRLDLAIPYEGDQGLWRVRASIFSSGSYPEIEVRDHEIVFSVSFPDDSVNRAELQSKIDRQIECLAEATIDLGRDVESHNQSAPGLVRSAIQRKRRLAESVKGVVTALGIPMKRRDEPLVFIVPTIRRTSPLSRPKVITDPFKFEPFLQEEEYQHILKVSRSLSLVIERNPNTFATLKEEVIRTHFLLQLNGHYEGAATGETFNVSGKTDILVRVDDRNIFIAECKFWRGPKAFDEAIDQLLGYLSWRDNKCALFIFNKTKVSSAVSQKMHEIMQARPEYRRTVSYDPNGDSRYIFVKESDPGREIIITTQLYDMPTASE